MSMPRSRQATHPSKGPPKVLLGAAAGLNPWLWLQGRLSAHHKRPATRPASFSKVGCLEQEKLRASRYRFSCFCGSSGIPPKTWTGAPDLVSQGDWVPSIARMVHLNNDAVQKKGDNYGKFESANKLSLEEFQKYLDEHHVTQIAQRFS